MSADPLLAPLSLPRGPALKNRFALAPLTNTQSHPDGRLSDEEYRWLTMRAEGGFAMTMTCAAHVTRNGNAFPGQLGFFDDALLPGLTRLAAGLKAPGSVAIAQLHHGGLRADEALMGEAPVSASASEKHGARALRGDEVEAMVEAFVAAAVRAEEAGFDGVELHAAHGYLIAQFLSPTMNQRDDAWGGSLENRCRFLFRIVEGVRARCGADFQLGVRLSPERFGMVLAEVREVAQRLLDTGHLDFLDLSLWDVFKEPHEEAHRGRSLLSYFADLDRKGVVVGAAGNIRSAADARRCLEGGMDLAIVGRAAILHHDLPQRVAEDPDFVHVDLPVSPAYLEAEGLSPRFVEYMRRWEGFVEG